VDRGLWNVETTIERRQSSDSNFSAATCRASSEEKVAALKKIGQYRSKQSQCPHPPARRPHAQPPPIDGALDFESEAPLTANTLIARIVLGDSQDGHFTFGDSSLDDIFTSLSNRLPQTLHSNS